MYILIPREKNWKIKKKIKLEQDLKFIYAFYFIM